MANSLSAASAGVIRVGDRAVVRLGFGGMRLLAPGALGPPPDVTRGVAVLRRAIELGVDLVDTADSYGPGHGEELVARALHPYAEHVVVATKGGVVHDRPWRWEPDGRPEYLRRACEASLKRLRLDRIELYQLHAVDPKVPLEESVGALVELQREGKIRNIGVSNVTPEQLARAQAVAPVVSVQNRYSFSDRTSEDTLAACERDGIAFIPWSPLGRGEVFRDVVLARRAVGAGVTRAQLAIAWLLRRSSVMVPIPGTSSIDHLEENIAAADLSLRDDVFAELGA